MIGGAAGYSSIWPANNRKGCGHNVNTECNNRNVGIGAQNNKPNWNKLQKKYNAVAKE